MGYRIWQKEACFSVPQSHILPMKQALHAAGIANEWDRWEVTRSDLGEGDITNIFFVGENYWEMDRLMDTIAPFVNAGSFIWMVGEDGQHYRFEFDGDTCVEKHGRIVFD